MSDIPNDIRAKLKRLCPAKDHPWRWREDCLETPEGYWVLPLYKSGGTDMAACANIVPLNDGRWAVGFISDEAWGLDLHAYSVAKDTLEEAKRWVDMLIGFDSGEIPVL